MVPEHESPLLEPLPVLAWLLPLVHVIRRVGRRNRLAWSVLVVDAVIVAVLGFAVATENHETDWIAELGAEPTVTLGVRVEPFSEHLLVTSVIEGTPAHRVGVQRGDAIIAAGGERMRTRAALVQAVDTHPVGDPIELRLLRGGQVATAAPRLEPVLRVPPSTRRRVLWLRWGSVVVVAVMFIATALAMWRRGAARPWVALLSLAFLAAYAVAGAYIPPLLAGAIVAGLAWPAVVWLRSPESVASLRATTKTTILSALAFPPLWIRGVLLGLSFAYLADLPFPSIDGPAMTLAGAPRSWATVVLAVPLAEELIFRGLLLPAAARALRPWTALSLTSAAFGALHMLGTTNVALATAYGFVFGYVRLRTGRVLPCIVLHIALNGLAFAVGAS